ncbi:sodium:solute symporter family protein [Rheinheimera tilapiae]|uniref:Sodium:solute symporter family protein n=1 Tax=Rheinheimera tilapiae TaxID=875043 RepID=A0ABV6B951_9GAMM
MDNGQTAMQLGWLDGGVIVAYLLGTLWLGLWVSRRAGANLQEYFLAGKTMPWWLLGISNASGMFDIAGTMWLVTVCFLYGLKSAWLPWVWPIFNQVFLMVYLSAWLRRSNALTGADWLKSRFGDGPGSLWCQGVVVLFAVVSAVGFVAYGFQGIGKFAAVFLPWDLSSDTYALIIFALTTLYVIKGGMYGVVMTELLQFILMTLAAVAVGIIAMQQVSPEQLAAVIPAGWDSLWFGWNLDLDWSAQLPAAAAQIEKDGMQLFGIMIMLMLCKGVLFSMAGPVPNYDMQRILAAKSPSEAAKMSAVVSLVMFIPRYLMVAGFAVLALVYLRPEIAAAGSNFDFERLLPVAIERFVPAGLAGLLIAGLLAAFMSTFSASLNAAPVYLVHDVYRKFINPNRSEQFYVSLSRYVAVALVVVGTLLGLMLNSINDIMQWIFGALFGGYAAANLLKWHWWRFNSWGYAAGMLTGLIASLALPLLYPELPPLQAFPYLLVAGLVGSVAGTLLTKPEPDAVLCQFYKQVRPWGVWGPIAAKVQAADPGFVPDQTPGRDALNILVGMAWQLCLVVWPICLVIRQWSGFWAATALFALTSLWLYRFWYKTLKD